MKLILFIALLSVGLIAGFSASGNAEESCCGDKVALATCTGSASCNACKSCKYCKHCSKNGGSCGVCN